MQFSTSINNINEPKIQQNWWQRFISQPHQLFFSASILFAITIMVLTFISLLGKTTLDFSLVHGFGLNFAVFTNAFLGFLITVIPKYNASAVIDTKKYLTPWIIFELSIFMTLFINEFMGKLFISLVMFYFVYIFYKAISNGKAAIKNDSIYINTIFALGASLLFLETITFSNLSMLIFFAYLLSMVFLVALRMVPSFYFAYTRVQPWQRPDFIRPVSVTLFLLTGLFIQYDMNFLLKIVSFIDMVFFGYVVYKLNIYKKTPAILYILTLSFLWLEIGFISLFIESIFLDYTMKLSFHIFALGFILTLFIGFGSRVVLGHAVPAQTIEADKITKFLFIFTQIIIISRVLVSIFFITNSSFFTPILHLSTVLWIVLFLVWSFRYGKILLRVK